MNIIKKTNLRPIHLKNTRTGLIYLLFLSLIKINNNFIKLFPNPFKKLKFKIINLLGLSTLNFNIIDDFAYYKIGGEFKLPKTKKIFLFKLKKPEPGHVPKTKKKYKYLLNV